MKHSELIDLMKELESKFDIYSLHYRNVQYWPLIRINMGWELLLGVDPSKDSTDKTQNNDNVLRLIFKSLIKGIYRVFRKIRYLTKSRSAAWHIIKNLKKHDAIVCTVNDNCSEFIGNEHFNTYSDPIYKYIKEAGFNILSLDTSTHSNIKKPRYVPGLSIDELIKYYVQRQVFIDLLYMPVVDVALIDKISKYLYERIGFIPKTLNANIIKSSISRHIGIEKAYSEIFKMVKPISVFLYSYYYYLPLAIIDAAKKQNIKAVEIQHGVISDISWAYSNWLEVPKEGVSLLPEYFWLWDQTSFNTVNAWSNKIISHTPVIIGNLWHKYYQEYSIYFNIKCMDFIESIADKNINILFTMQGLFDDGLPNILRNVLLQTKNINNVKWYIRLHPRYLDKKKVIEEFLSINDDLFNVEYENTTKSSILPLMSKMDYHLTCSSASVYEADQCRVQNIILDSEGLKQYQNKIDSGLYLYINNSDDLYNNISNKLEFRPIVQKYNGNEVNHHIKQLLSKIN